MLSGPARHPPTAAPPCPPAGVRDVCVCAHDRRPARARPPARGARCTTSRSSRTCQAGRPSISASDAAQSTTNILPRRHHYLRAMRLRPRPELPSDLILCDRPATRQQHAGGQQQRGRIRRGRPPPPATRIRAARHCTVDTKRPNERVASGYSPRTCSSVSSSLDGSWAAVHIRIDTDDGAAARSGMSGVCSDGGSVCTARARAGARAPHRPPRRPGLVRGRARVPTIRDGPHSQKSSAWWL